METCLYVFFMKSGIKSHGYYSCVMSLQWSPMIFVALHLGAVICRKHGSQMLSS